MSLTYGGTLQLRAWCNLVWTSSLSLAMIAKGFKSHECERPGIANCSMPILIACAQRSVFLGALGTRNVFDEIRSIFEDPEVHGASEGNRRSQNDPDTLKDN